MAVAAMEVSRHSPARVLIFSGIAARLLELLWPLDLPAFPGYKHLALAFAILGFLLFFLALRSMRRANTFAHAKKPTWSLVTGGPYRLCRHPMYLGLFLIYLAFVFARHTFWVVFFGVLAAYWIFFKIVPKEDRFLRERFGEEYEAYRKKVRL